MTRRTDRIGSLIRQTLGELLLSKISDPCIEPALTSITHVDVADDLLSAKVYVSIIGSQADQRKALRALQRAGGRLQELMMRQITLRHTPILEFVTDVEFKRTLQTLEIIEKAMTEIRVKDETSDNDEHGAGQ